MGNIADKMREMEGAGSSTHEEVKVTGRMIKDFCNSHWQMERMRPGQGIAEGIHDLANELSGNNFSWNFATIPGDVYTDLYHAGEIDDPIYGRNMAKCKWVQDYEWWYNYGFQVDEEMKGKKITLIFEGVDYSCDVWLNTHYLGRHEGMMSSFQFDVTDYVDFSTPHTPSNLLAIKLDPPPKNQKNFAGLKHNFAGDYLTGVIPFGIWKPVKLIATKDVRIENYRIESKVNSDTNADVDIDMEITGLVNGDHKCQVNVLLKDGDKGFSKTLDVTLKPGLNTLKCQMNLDDVKLWWPYDLGDPFRYDLAISVVQDGEVLDNIEGKVGIREVTMTMNPGFTPEEAENPWTFVINGKSMFLRSACWGGQPSFFYERNSREKYRLYLEAAKECNINNLRMFGWHPAEVEDFYDICDELGLTVWTNYSFATQVFRDDEEYLRKVDSEIAEIVKDRRNHPSTIMWMGGEEVYFTEAHVHSNNRRLMERLGRVTKQFTNVPYADASPLSSREGIRMGYKSKESLHANSHYYAAGAIFMEDYYPNLDCCIVPELTAASSPNVESLKKFIPENELWPMGLSWGYHAGDMHVLEILNYEVFGDTCMDSLEHFVEATQIAQGTIFQYSLEHFRRCKPHVSGVALCHFITNWPIIKWDVIDYYGTRKKSFDFVKQSYQQLLPSLQFPKRRYLPGEVFEGKLFIINDLYKTFEDLKYTCVIKDAKKNVVKEFVMDAKIGENTVSEIGAVDWTVEGVIGETFSVELKLESADGKELATNAYDILILDQKKAMEEAYALNQKMRAARDQYGRGYYRYTPDQIDNR